MLLLCTASCFCSCKSRRRRRKKRQMNGWMLLGFIIISAGEIESGLTGGDGDKRRKSGVFDDGLGRHEAIVEAEKERRSPCKMMTCSWLLLPKSRLPSRLLSSFLITSKVYDAMMMIHTYIPLSLSTLSLYIQWIGVHHHHPVRLCSSGQLLLQF